MPQSKIGWKGFWGYPAVGWHLLLEGLFRAARRAQTHLLGTHLDLHTPYTILHCRTEPSGFRLVFPCLCCLAFTSILLFFPSFSQWSLEFISIRLPSGFLGGDKRHRTIHSSNRTLPMNPTNSKCKKLVVCSHQCHKIVPKIKISRFSQPGHFSNPDCVCLKACERKQWAQWNSYRVLCLHSHLYK